jgi:hypothetical protein
MAGHAKVLAYLAAEEDAEPFERKMHRLVAQLREQQAEARRLDAAIEANQETPGYTFNERALFR